MKILATFPWATKEIWEWIERIEGEFQGPVWVTGLWRDPIYNALVGGVSNSRHMVADAADLDTNSPQLDDLEAAARKTAPHGGQVVRLRTYVHIEIARDPT